MSNYKGALSTFAGRDPSGFWGEAAASLALGPALGPGV